MFVYLFITVFLVLLYIPLSMMWTRSGAEPSDDDLDDHLPEMETIEDAFRYNRAGGDMYTSGMGDRPLE